MQAWVVDHCAPIDEGPLSRVERRAPVPGPGQVRIGIICCGLCRTDLHLAEGDLLPRRASVAPGHEIVGRVDALGTGSTRFAVGDRIGVPWLAGADGRCRYCRRGEENLCEASIFTGWDLDGGCAGSAVVDQDFAYLLPQTISDEQAAPLLCAGIIGYRSLQAARLPPAAAWESTASAVAPT